MRKCKVIVCTAVASLAIVFGSVRAIADDVKPEGVPGTKSFGGLSWGIGLGLTIDTGKRSRVASAEVVNGVVRVSEQHDAIAGFVLESHYFFVPKAKLFGSVESGYWGHGPFVAFEAGAQNSGIVNAYGLGWMIGLRQPSYQYNSTKKDWEKTYSSSSWNLGVGLRVDPNVKVLGDGIIANVLCRLAKLQSGSSKMLNMA